MRVAALNLGKLGKGQVVWMVAGVLALLGVGYFLVRQTLRAAGGVLTGNNALTEGTAYEGAGVAGTLGAATDKVLGGLPSAVGGAIGRTIYDLMNDGYDGYLYGTFPDGSRGWKQVIRRSDGKIFNVDLSGNITGPA